MPLPSIYEIKHTLAGERQEFPCSLLAYTENEAVLLFEITHAHRIADLTIPSGSLSLGYFWPNRPYNVYHWLDPSGHTLGVYCIQEWFQ